MNANAIELCKTLQRFIAAMRRDDPALSVRVKQGSFQIVRATYKKNGASNVKVESPWIPLGDLAA